MLSVFSEKYFARHKIQSTTNHIASCKCWSILNTFAGRSKEIAIISMVSIWGLIPTGKAIQWNRLLAQTDTHEPYKMNTLICAVNFIGNLPIQAFADHRDFKIVDNTRPRNWAIGSHSGRIFTVLTRPFACNKLIFIWWLGLSVLRFVTRSKSDESSRTGAIWLIPPLLFCTANGVQRSFLLQKRGNF